MLFSTYLSTAGNAVVADLLLSFSLPHMLLFRVRRRPSGNLTQQQHIRCIKAKGAMFYARRCHIHAAFLALNPSHRLR